MDFVLAPANAHDLTVGADLLATHRELVALGDKAYRSAAVAAALQAEAAVTLVTVPREDERAQLPPAVVHQHAHWREIVETVNGQLGEQFHLETNHAKTFWGLCARLYSKLTAHTLGGYLNRLLGQPNCLQIKGLAFAN